MKHIRISSTLLVVVVAIGLTILTGTRSRCAAEDGEQAPKTIGVDDLVYVENARQKDKTVVIGRLGQPLREVMSLKGIWVDPGKLVKDRSLRFQVLEVNGRELDKPVDFYLRCVEVVKERDNKIRPTAAGEKWELRAYEAWTNYGHPQKYWDELGVPPGGAAQRNKTTLIGVLKKAGGVYSPMEKDR
jgi:hypothetical protein